MRESLGRKGRAPVSIRFPDFSLLFHRSVDRHGPEPRGGVSAPEQAHAQTLAIAQENERRRVTIQQGREADRARLTRQRERRGRKGPPPGEEGKAKGRHVDLQA